MAAIPSYSPITAAVMHGGFGAPDAVRRQPLATPPSAAVSPEEVERLGVSSRVAVLQTARPSDTYSMLDGASRAMGVSVADMVGAAVAQAIVARRAAVVQVPIFSSEEKGSSSPSGPAREASGMPPLSYVAGIIF